MLRLRWHSCAGNRLKPRRNGLIYWIPPRDGTKGQENCLNLNIYRPQTTDSQLPVLFYIHGAIIKSVHPLKALNTGDASIRMAPINSFHGIVMPFWDPVKYDVFTADATKQKVLSSMRSKSYNVEDVINAIQQDHSITPKAKNWTHISLTNYFG